MPIAPNNPKARRHDINENTHITSNGVNTPPARAQPHQSDSAAALRARQPVGEHLRQVWKTAGFTRPEKKSRQEQRPQVPSPASEHSKDRHQTTTRMSTLRGPNLSPSQPPGI